MTPSVARDSSMRATSVGVAADERHVGCLDGDIRAGADGDAQVGLRQRGASLMPSPTIATRRPAAWSVATWSALSAGRTSARTWSMPPRGATASAARGCRR